MSEAFTLPEEIQIECQQCRKVFSHPDYIRVRYCSDACKKERDRIRKRELPPAAIMTMRARCRTWAAANRNVKAKNAWLAGAPPHDGYLPGVSMAFDVRPAPTWPIELRNTRGLHGAITAVLGEGHGHRLPTFALFPYGSGWAVHWWSEGGTALANKTVEGMLYQKPVAFHFGPAFRLRAPVVKRRGRRQLRLDTITPIINKSDGRTRTHERPTSLILKRALEGEWLQRFGCEYVKAEDLLRVETIKVDTHTARVDLGGKYGVVTGWEGSVELDTNAVGEWLLTAGARVGFGARTAFGFGRIRVTAC